MLVANISVSLGTHTHNHMHINVKAHTNIHSCIHYVYIYMHTSRLTVVSREAKKKQHACASSDPRDHYSELFTRMAALKF